MSELQALNSFHSLHLRCLSSWPSFLGPGNQGVCLGGGCGRGVTRWLKSETMCHNIRGFFLRSCHFSPVSSTPFFPILNATLVLFYLRGAAFSKMGDLFLPHSWSAKGHIIWQCSQWLKINFSLLIQPRSPRIRAQPYLNLTAS